MTEISNDYISDCAENYLSTFLTGKRISSDILKHEKRELWDGNILVYDNNQRKKEGLERIPLQIKGTIQSFNGKFSINKNDLMSYRKEQGVLYFVVKMDLKEDGEIDKDKADVYLALLTRNSIDKYLLKIVDDNVTVDFKQIKSEDVLKLCRKFLYIRNMYNNFEEIEKEDFSKIEKITITSFDKEDEDSDLLFKEDIVAMAKISGREKEKIINFSSFKTEKVIYKDVKLDDKTFYNSYVISKEKGKYNFYLEDGILFEIPLDLNNIPQNGKMNITFSTSKSLKQYLRKLTFLTDFFTANKIEFGNLSLNLKNFKSDSDDIIEFKKQILNTRNKLEEINKFVDCFELEDVDLTTITKDNVSFVGEFFKGEVKISMDIAKYICYLFGNKTIFLSFNKKRKNVFEAFNGFDKLDDTLLCKYPKRKPFKSTILLEMPKEILLKADNINFDKIEKAINSLKISSISLQESSILFLIRLIECFDISNNVEFLNKALILCNKTKIFNEKVTLINEIQIKKRLKLNIENDLEKLSTELNKTQTNDKQDIMFKVCANILLENKYEVKKYIKLLEEKELLALQKWPIYRLYK